MLARLLLALLAMPLITIFMTSSDAKAASIWADARVFALSPAYSSHTQGDFAISFRELLPYGSKVEVHVGLGGVVADLLGEFPVRRVDWRETKTIEAQAVAPYEWTANVNEALNAPEQGWAYDRLQFVFVVTLPNGEKYYDKGSATRHGFYEATLPAPVETNEQEMAKFVRLQIKPIARHELSKQNK